MSEEMTAEPDDAIVEPEPASEPDPQLFKRPSSGFLERLVNRILPPAPPDQVKLEFGNFQKELHGRDYLRSFAMLAVFLGLIAFQAWLWRGFLWSPAVAVWFLVEWIGGGLIDLVGHSAATIIGNALIALILLLMVRAIVRRLRRRLALKRNGATKTDNAEGDNDDKPKRVSVLSRAAVSEEQWFREGAERWNKRQRFLSCLGFAVVHLGNVIYSIATLLPLGIMGYVFMRAYLREYKATGERTRAVLRSSKLHRLYNRIAFWASGIQIVVIVVFHLSIIGHV